ncbi:MAG: hypothetical protein EB127_13485 [Alphaproteobacteria bacterium]|nr:hypothetical protein [Alphaproteobacteria bacterium]
MLLRKQEPSLSKPIRTYETTLLWCSDGWVYDTTTKTRRRYKTDGNLFSMEEEPTTRTVYSDVQNIEAVTIKIYQENPKIWLEEGVGWSETFG